MSVTEQRPPVNEVVLSAAFEPQDLLLGPRLAEMLESWIRPETVVQAMPHYEVPHEAETAPTMQGQPRLEFLGANFEPRYWLSRPGDNYLVQVQRDYLALNWRRTDDQMPYVHYNVLRKRFEELLRATSSKLEAQGGAVKPLRGELTYVNLIRPNELWSDTGATHRLLGLIPPPGVQYESISWSITQRLEDDAGRFAGRLHATLQPTFDWLKDEPNLAVNLTARSGDLAVNAHSLLDFLDLAHQEINALFLRLLTEDARNLWRLRR